MSLTNWTFSDPMPPDLPSGVSGIYIIRNLAYNRVYVGSSTDVRRRWREHARALASDSHSCRGLNRAWFKQGPHNFRFELVTRCANSDLAVMEQLTIHQYQASLYNVQKAVARAGAAAAKRQALRTFRKNLMKSTPQFVPLASERNSWESWVTGTGWLWLLLLLCVPATIAAGLPTFSLLAAAWTLGGLTMLYRQHDPYRRLARERSAYIEAKLRSLHRALYPVTRRSA